jgi:hypothetical protein
VAPGDEAEGLLDEYAEAVMRASQMGSGRAFSVYMRGWTEGLTVRAELSDEELERISELVRGTSDRQVTWAIGRRRGRSDPS